VSATVQPVAGTGDDAHARTDRVSGGAEREAVAACSQTCDVELDRGGGGRRGRRGDRVPLDVGDADGADLREPVVELGRVAHDHHEPLLGAHVGACGLLHVRGGHGGDARAVRLQVVGGEAQRPHLRHLLGDLLRRLDAEREGADQRALGVLQLRGGDRLRTEPAQLGDELDERGVGHLVAHLGRGDEGADATRPGERRRRAVRPPPALAKDLEEARVGAAAEQLVADGRRVPGRVGGAGRQVAGDDVGLHRARTVDQHDLRARAGSGRGGRRGGGRRARPPGKALLGDAAQVGHRDVTGDHEQRPLRAQPRLLEGDEVVARDRANRGRTGSASVRVLAVQAGAEDPVGDRGGLRELQLERREHLRPRELDLGGRELRPRHGVAEQAHRERGVVRQHRARDAQEVGARRPAERAAGALDRGGDLVGRAAAGALGEQLSDHVGDPFLAGRRMHGPGWHREAEGDDGVTAVLDEHHAHAVGERGFLERREGRRAHRRGSRGARGVLRAGARDDRSGEAERDERGLEGGAGEDHGLGASDAAGAMRVTTLFSGMRYLRATRWTSATVTAA
jgi:hypothetical protein